MRPKQKRRPGVAGSGADHCGDQLETYTKPERPATERPRRPLLRIRTVNEGACG